MTRQNPVLIRRRPSFTSNQTSEASNIPETLCQHAPDPGVHFDHNETPKQAENTELRSNSSSVDNDQSSRRRQVLAEYEQHSKTMQPNRLKAKYVINARLLIPGRGQPKGDHSVVIEDGMISRVEPTASLAQAFRGLPTTDVPVLMPGLWDCHVHFLGSRTLIFSEIVAQHNALAGARIARNLHDVLMSGFTSVRELGGYGLDVAKAIEEDTLVGPNIYSTGAAISQTAGHGDAFDLPAGLMGSLWGVRDTQANGLSPGSGPIIIADGVDECRRAVRLLLRRGAKCIKVFASGGVLSIADDPLRQQFSLEELKTIVEEAERNGRVVAAHVHGKPGIMAALRAGVHTIEHGTYMDDECVEIMKKQGTVYVPTRTVVKVGVDHPELMSPESYRKMLETAKYHKQAYQLAVKSGLKIALGTDLGISAPTSHPLAHGRNGGELTYAVTDGGMTALQAIEAGTAMGPETLGDLGMKPKSGRIEVGYDADLIALSANPLEDMEVFKHVDKVTHVWKGGRLFKAPKMDKMDACW
jgi:imidazolonepropionase-like amidohydrolase